ncbi:hypothetical protein KGY64_00920 [Candidatus Bipolaricaulota bacterium]|nr:hypothetical protein [Candidatus Bipolaricaulota bacterium]
MTLEEAENMATVEGWGGLKDNVGDISGSFADSAVSVQGLVEKVRDNDKGNAVRAVVRRLRDDS